MEKTKVIMRIESYSNKDGILVLGCDPIVRSAISGLVDWCQERYGSYIKLEMSCPYRPKTQKELGKFFAMCTEYAHYLGSTKKQVEEGIKWRAMEEGLWEGIEIPYHNTTLKVPMSIVYSDTKQLAILIDVLYREGAEQGYIFEEDR